jgi:hypothetical protein
MCRILLNGVFFLDIDGTLSIISVSELVKDKGKSMSCNGPDPLGLLTFSPATHIDLIDVTISSVTIALRAFAFHLGRLHINLRFVS